VELPLFPSYLFVFVNPNNYYEVLEVPGISRYLFFEGRAATIAQKEIDNIKKLINSDLDLEVVNENLIPGDQVEITHGSLRGLKGEMVSYKGTKKVAIKINEIEFSLLIQVPINHIKLLPAKT
jgi:transcriptional antiterminator RfaH